MSTTVRKNRCAAALVVITLIVPRLTLAQATPPLPHEVRGRAVLAGITVPLNLIPVPDAVGLDLFVQDRAVLRVLGKALFWDQQLGSDGNACASCHFHAGVDNRSKNQLNPGLKNESALFPIGDTLFGNSGFTGVPAPSHFGPNYQLKPEDFPLRKLSNPNDRTSPALSDTNDVVSSQGVLNAALQSTALPVDVGSPIAWIFNQGGVLVRNVEPRNTPSTINAVFNSRNFWDGRARSIFNGVNPFGELDPAATVAFYDAGATPPASFASVQIDIASLASQAVGPPLSDLEMAYHGQIYPQLGRKLLADDTVVLANQRVAPDDSVLGPYSLRGAGTTPGTSLRYRLLIEAAFRPMWWSAPGWRVQIVEGVPALIESETLNATTFTMMEYNFPLFFGLALAEYQRTLVSDQTRFDFFMSGNDGALSPAEVAGLDVFVNPIGGRCVACHGGPELTTAAVRLVGENPIARMILGDGRVGAYDEGFYNIGVRPSAEDAAVGGRVLGEDLSLARRQGACVSARVAEGQSVEQANVTCQVPRIIAIPFDAAILLRQAAALAGNPANVIALLDEADALLRVDGVEVDVPLDLVAASIPLQEAHGLLAPLVATIPEIAPLLADAALVLPDPNAEILPDPPLPLEEQVLAGTRFAPFGPLLGPNERIVANGAFKTPSLRNVELTAPYFHNGGQATLEQVVEFYDRGGDFGHLNPQDLDVDILPLGLTTEQRANLVAFLNSLTDERVRWDRAPFDHPSLDLPNGGTAGLLDFSYFPGIGVLDDRIVLPETGASGSQVRLGTSNTPFANFLQPLGDAPVPPTPATGVSLVAEPGSPSTAGTSVVFTAVGSGSTTGGSPTPSARYQYRFWIDDGAGWVVAQDYGFGSTYTLPSPGAGTYRVAAWVRTTTGVPADVYGNAVTQVVAAATPTPATGLTLTANPASPNPTGTSVVFTASGSGSTTEGSPTPPATYQYRFWVNEGAGWVMVQDYGIDSTYALTTPVAGIYQVAAWVRTTSGVPADVYGNAVTHVVGASTPTPAIGLAVTANPTSPSPTGTSVLFTAAGSGSTTSGAPSPPATYQYRFWVDGGAGWVIAQDYGVGSTYSLTNPAARTYRVAVWVRTTTAVEADLYGGAATHVVGLETPTPASGVNLVAEPASPSATGTSVVFTAAGSGSTTGGSPTPPATYQYRFWVNDGAGWVMAQDYGVGSAYTLTTPAAGNYQVAAWVRTATGVEADFYGDAVLQFVQ